MKEQAKILFKICFVFAQLGLLATIGILLTEDVKSFQELQGRPVEMAMAFAWAVALLLGFVSALNTSGSLAKSMLKWAFVVLLMAGQAWFAGYVAIQPMLARAQTSISDIKQADTIKDIDNQIKLIQDEIRLYPETHYTKKRGMLDKINALIEKKVAIISTPKHERIETKIDYASIGWILFFRIALEIGLIILSNTIKKDISDLLSIKKTELIKEVAVSKSIQKPFETIKPENSILGFIRERGAASWNQILQAKKFGNAQKVEPELKRLLDSGAIIKTSNGSKGKTIYAEAQG